MKGRRNLVDCKIKKGKEVGEVRPVLCSFIENVPETILIEIFLRLSIKEIIMCKSVCKIWYRMLRMPEFAKQHFDCAQPCAVIKRSRPLHVSRMLYLVEPHKINLTYCLCDDSDDEWAPCNHQVSLKLKLDTSMKIPLRNIEWLPQVSGTSKTKQSRVRNKCCTKAMPSLYKFRIVNSCNGFLCLSDPQSNNPMAVCNPVTGEYLTIRGSEIGDEKMGNIICGFGYSPKLNKYKVIRMFEQGELQVVHTLFDGSKRYSRTIAETYTFGKGSWERIGNVPVFMHSNQSLFNHRKIFSHHFPIYCNGSVNWLHGGQQYGFDENPSICSFDLDNDVCKAIELPTSCARQMTQVSDSWGTNHSCLGELDGCLCLLFNSPLSKSFSIWVMKKYGSPSSWTEIITVHEDPWRPCESYLPISYAENAGLIMFTPQKNAFVHFNQYHDWKYLKISGVKSDFEAYSYVPTLASLKDALTNEDKDEILNVNTKDVKLLGETKPLFLVEEDRDMDTPTGNSDPDQSNEDSI